MKTALEENTEEDESICVKGIMFQNNIGLYSVKRTAVYITNIDVTMKVYREILFAKTSMYMVHFKGH